MNYRNDEDLSFLQSAHNDDLSILVNYLTEDEKGHRRLTETLTCEQKYKEQYPNHKMYWELIATEFQYYGANTIMSVFRGKGVIYREILIDVCEKLKVNFNKRSTIEVIEMNLLTKILTDSLEKMTPEQVEEVAKDLNIKNLGLGKQAVLAAIQGAIRLGGFGSYKLALIVANAVAKQILGKGLTFAFNASITRSIAVFAGPIGLVITSLWAIIDVAGPAYRVTIPCVIQIAYMRAKMSANLEIEDTESH